MEVPSLQQLDAMQYWQLQKLAKTAGFKANLKADKLLRSLKAHFHPLNKTENVKMGTEGSHSVIETKGFNRSKLNEEISSASPTLSNNITVAVKESDTEQVKEENSDKMDMRNLDRSNSEIKQKKPVKVDETNEQTLLETPQKTDKHWTQNRRCSPDVTADGKTPIYTARLTKSSSKQSTPNFKKLHEAHFKRMESIDKYMERKQKRLEAVGTSIHKVKIQKKKSHLLAVKEKTPVLKETIKGRLSLLSPAKWTTTPHAPVGCSAELPKSSMANTFKSSVSSSKINNRFSEATTPNEHKGSPVRKLSSTADNVSTRSLRSIGNAIPLPATVKLEPAITALKFSAETPNISKKAKFDLQASLARPLAYHPYKGKLKPWRDSKEKQSTINTKVSLLKNTFKQPHLHTREDRRRQHEKNRKNKRDQTLETRRGVELP
ncbi:nucleolar and spindle-associated protein 1 [Spea bombifrons]|uniref:nucleolar and spindle-associated protein 1 n=1 Tax=Spea bombifrons TaxID=233779 RepID=UPI00234AD267|nr:nucleolar and spindle-associated protein 1 [Spea bombifrons]